MNGRPAEFETLTNQERSSITQMLTEMLSAYDKQRDDKDVKQFCVEYAQQLNTYDDDNAALMAVTQACDTIDRIDEEYRSLREAGKRGTSRADWLRRVLEEHVHGKQGETRNQAMTEIQQSVADAAANLFRAVTKRDIPIATPQQEYSLDNPVVAQMTANNLADNAQDIAELSSILIADQFPQNGEHHVPGIGIVKEFFDRELGSPQDRDLKKVVANAAINAKKMGVLRTPEKMGTKETAAAIDLGLETIKAAYKTAKGEHSFLDALEHVYDRAIAVTSSIIQHHASSIGGAIGMSVGATIGTLFSAAGALIGGQIGAMIGIMAGETIGDALAVGVKHLAEQAKSFVKTAWHGEKRDATVAVTHNA